MRKNIDTHFALVTLIQRNYWQIFFFKLLLIYEHGLIKRFLKHFRKRFYVNLKNAIGYSLAVSQLAISKPRFEGSKKLTFLFCQFCKASYFQAEHF